MLRCKTLLLLCAVGATTLLGSLSAGEPNKKEADSLVIVDGADKEHKVKAWRFTAGTKHLSWLAPAGAVADPEPEKGGKKGAAKTRATVGPVALEFSEGSGVPLKKRIVTYVLLENIRSIDYDAAKKEVTLKVAKSANPEEDIELKGITGYVDVNVLTIEAKVDLGELGSATTKFQGGVANGVKSIRFPSPKPVAAPPKEAKPAVIVSAGKDKTDHAAMDLQALYLHPDGGLATSQTLYFKDTVKVELSKLKKLSHTTGLTFDLTLASGQNVPLVLMERVTEGKNAVQLQGILGRVPAGWKVFPMGTVGEMTYGLKKILKDA